MNRLHTLFSEKEQGFFITGKEGKMKVYRFFLLVCGFVSLGFFHDVQAQEKYPNRPIALVVPFTPGGSNDVQARIYSVKLEQALKTQVIVVNRAGGGGIQGALNVSRAKKDGYTFLSTGISFEISPLVNPREATYSPLKDFMPLGYLGYSPMCLVVRSDSPFKTFGELVEYARKNPNELKDGEGGGINNSYLNIELMRAKGIKFTSIPFGGAGEAILNLLGGHIDTHFGSIINSAPHIKAGKLRGLAVISEKRIPSFPDIPTTAELGYPYIAFNGWLSAFAPRGIPKSAYNVLVQGIKTAFTDPEVARKLDAIGVISNYLNPDDLRKLIESETIIIEKIVKDAGLKTK